jgi:enterochelin esterase-like enzyme
MLAEGNDDVAPRIVQVYIPHGMKRSGKAHYLYVNDGAQAVTIGKFVNVLDNLFYHEPHVPKTIVVFVPPVERHEEYMMSKTFADWYVTSLVKQVERKTRFRSDAHLRTVQGASLGALFAMYLGMEHYKLFRNIAAQSPSFWIEDFAIVRQLAKRKALPLRIYLQTGTINDAEVGARKMLRVLQAKEYDTIYRESNESHNWANWSARYADIVRWSSAR